MTKKHFILLAEYIQEHNRVAANRATYGVTDDVVPFNADHLDVLACFCAATNPQFNRNRWLGYIRGENGPNGGAIKPSTKVA